jgi:ethanolamine utilization protein EutM
MPADPAFSLALLEVANLAPSLLLVDRCTKAAGVRVIGVESADGAGQCIKLAGPASAVRQAGEAGLDLARHMGASALLSILPGPLPESVALASMPPVYNPLLGIYDSRVPQEDTMNTTQALGLLETQGLVAALHATDEMLKAAAVTIAGKEKIGAAYVTIVIRGDVAAVQAAISTGKAAVERLGGKLIMADVIPRPHPDLTALLPK